MGLRSAERAAQRAAVRGDRDGSGPTLHDRPAARFPGAGAKFALLGEVLVVGVLVTLLSLFVVTLPIAVAAGIRHLRRFIAAEDSRLRLFWADVRAGVLTGAVVGAVAGAAVLLLLLDIDLARSGVLPGAGVIEVVGWVGLVVVPVALLVIAQQWTPETGWRDAVRRVPASIAADLGGAAYLVTAVLMVALLTSILPPLLPAAIGLALFAAVAVPHRPRRLRA